MFISASTQPINLKTPNFKVRLNNQATLQTQALDSFVRFSGDASNSFIKLNPIQLQTFNRANAAVQKYVEYKNPKKIKLYTPLQNHYHNITPIQVVETQDGLETKEKIAVQLKLHPDIGQGQEFFPPSIADVFKQSLDTLKDVTFSEADELDMSHDALLEASDIIKPLIYAAGIETGLLTSEKAESFSSKTAVKHLLKQDYSPQNYQQLFKLALIEIKEATDQKLGQYFQNKTSLFNSIKNLYAIKLADIAIRKNLFFEGKPLMEDHTRHLKTAEGASGKADIEIPDFRKLFKNDKQLEQLKTQIEGELIRDLKSLEGEFEAEQVKGAIKLTTEILNKYLGIKKPESKTITIDDLVNIAVHKENGRTESNYYAYNPIRDFDKKNYKKRKTEYYNNNLYELIYNSMKLTALDAYGPRGADKPRPGPFAFLKHMAKAWEKVMADAMLRSEEGFI